jgi:hypothetical protein
MSVLRVEFCCATLISPIVNLNDTLSDSMILYQSLNICDKTCDENEALLMALS